MVFFSGTDWSELEDNAPNHNYYLSLIVNNFMDFCAKVCFIAEAENEVFSFIAKDENGKKYTAQKGDYSVSPKLIVYDCEIDSPKKNIEVQKSFTEKVNSIIQKAEKVVLNTSNNSSVKPGKNWSEQQESREIDWTSRRTTFADTIEEFIDVYSMFVINTGNSIENFKDLEEICEFYEASRVTGSMLAGRVAATYVDSYQKFFSIHGDEIKDPNMFHKATEELIWELESEIETTHKTFVSEILKPCLEVIKKILKDFNTKITK